MWVAKADLVPTDANLVEEYVDWPELAAACEEFMASVNGRERRGGQARAGGGRVSAQEHEARTGWTVGPNIWGNADWSGSELLVCVGKKKPTCRVLGWLRAYLR